MRKTEKQGKRTGVGAGKFCCGAILLILFWLAGAGSAQADETGTAVVDGWRYELHEDGTAMLAEIGQESEVIIPERIRYENRSYEVTELKKELCFGNKRIEKVEFPDSILRLPNDAFYQCRNLRQVRFPGKLKRIGARCFYQCFSLEEILLPDSVEEVGKDAFNLCIDVRRLHLSRALRSIGAEAFQGSSWITELELPARLETIGNNAFRYCFNLSRYYVESGSLYFTAVDGVLFNRDRTELVAYPAGKEEEEYQIPNGVRVISDTSMGFQDSIESNGVLKRLYVPNSVNEISDRVLFGQSVVLYGRNGSYIHRYATEHGLSFTAVSVGHIPIGSAASAVPREEPEAERQPDGEAVARDRDGEEEPAVPAKIVLKKGKKNRKKITPEHLEKDAAVTFRIRNKKIATVSGKGMITGKKKGKTKLIVRVRQNGENYRLVVKIIVK